MDLTNVHYFVNLKTMKLFNTLLCCTLLCSTFVFAQEDSDLRNFHKEEADPAFPYVVVDKSKQKRSTAYKVRNSSFFTTQVNVDATGNNIIGDAGNEPSLAIDPTNPDRIVIGWRQFDDIASSFRQAGYGFSLDGGQTFTFPGVLDPGVFRSDPVLDFDSDGNFYYNSLKDTFECDVYAIQNGGVVWGAPVPARGGDKQWMRVDRSGSSGDTHNYSYWNVSFTTCAPGAFTRSTDEGASFENCTNIPNDPFWGTLAVDANGDLYTVGRLGTNVIQVAKSTTAKDAGAAVTWDQISTVNLEGALTAGAVVNPSGLLGQAWIDTDNSTGPGSGNVYVLASVIRTTGPADAGDVMFSRSTDGGNTFEPAVRINQDNVGNNAIQWFGTMSVAPNGRIDVIWLDTRAATNTVDSVLYYRFSEDQGTTWSDEEVLSNSFDPTVGYPIQMKMGDYFDMKSDNNFAHIAWANTLNGGQDVYYTRISPSILAAEDISETITGAIISPNPIDANSVISFSGPLTGKTTVSVYDVLGKKVNVLYDDIAAGPQRIKWNGTNASAEKLTDGVYFITIENGSNQTVLKAIVQ